MNDSTKQNTLSDGIRSFVAFMCRGIYFILGGLYDVLMDIAKSTDIISSVTISNIFSRIQLIIGIFMIFRLTMFALQSIVDPDKMTDSKSGVGNIIQKILVSLLMLSLIIPIQGIPDNATDYEKKIKEEGILFGTMNELQSRLLTTNDGQNVLAKFVLGPKTETSSLNSTGQNLSLIVMKGFFTPNLVPGKQIYKTNKVVVDGKVSYQYQKDDLYCYDGSSPDEKTIWDYALFSSEIGVRIQAGILGNAAMDLYEWFTDDTARPEEFYNSYYYAENISTLFNLVDAKCDRPTGGTYYAFTFNWFSALLVGLVFVIVMVLLCVEVAKRLIKLAILRLIAPIPVISYMNPKTDFNNGPLGAWIKLLISTYLDLFLNLTIIYFVIFLIQEINHSNSLTNTSAGIIAKIFIYLALLLFAKDSPKFIKQALGIKDDGGGFFSGIGGKILGTGLAAAGAVGAARVGYRAAKEENDKLYPKQGKRNVARNLISGLTSGFAGAGTGIHAAMTNKDHQAGAAIKALREQNARRAAHSTFLGRAADSIYEMGTGQSLADKASQNLELNKKAFGDLKNWKSSVKDEAIKNGGSFDYRLSNGTVLSGITYDQVNGAKSAGADANGNYHINGQTVHSSLLGDVAMDDLADKQVEAWMGGSIGTDANGNLKKSYTETVEGTGKLSADHERVIKAVNDAGITIDGKGGADLVDNYGKLGQAMGIANRAQQNEETNMKQIKRMANKQNKK